MIQAYIFKDGLFLETEDISAAQWINIESQDSNALKEYAEKLGITEDFMLAANDPHERALCKKDDDQTLIVIRVSHMHNQKRHTPFGTIPVSIILTAEKVVTVSTIKGVSKTLVPNKHFSQTTWSPIWLMLVMLLRVCKNYIEHIHLIDLSTQNLESSLQKSMQNKELLDLMHAERALIYLLTSLKSNQNMLEKIQKQTLFTFTPDELDLYEDIIIENVQAMSMADVFTQVLGNIGDAFGAIISNNLNQAMKFLTGMTIVLMIPTIVVGAYGMNVRLPFAEHPAAFPVLFATCIFSCALVWFMFSRKQWM